MSKLRSTLPENIFEDKLKQYFSASPFFIIGVSGGVDSMVLLYILYKLEVKALVVHINYGLRGDDADLDQELVEGMAIEWGFDCQSFSINFDESSERNVQKWARDERYRIFRDLKDVYNADAVLVAHHQDDQVETIIQKLFRGASPVSWNGMSEYSDQIFRPLLGVPKEEIIRYATSEAIPFREDASNRESKYARNLLRLEVFKQLDDFFPGWKRNILDLPSYSRLVAQTIQTYSDQVSDSNGDIVIEMFNKLDNESKPAVLKHIIEARTDNTLSKGVLFELVSLIDAQTGRGKPISAEYSFVIDRGVARVQKLSDEPFLSRQLSLEELKQGCTIDSLIIGLGSKKGGEKDIYMDADRIIYPIEIRRWEQGDYIQPLGMNGRQKISDHLTNKKVSTIDRKKTLVLSGGDGTIYAIIFPTSIIGGHIGTISNLAACSDTTTNFLVIQKDSIS